MNKVILIGNLTKDAELTFGKGTGNAITKFNLAVSRGYKDKNETDFINCVVFGKIAENVAQYTSKGSKVAVEGSLRINNYTDKDGNKRSFTEIYVNNIEFLNKVGSSTTNTPLETANNTVNSFTENFNVDDKDDIFLEPLDEGDMPF